jgi:hypothetical protein
MAKAHGKGSSLTFTNLTVGDFAFTIDDNTDVVEVTDFADGAAGFKKWLAGLRDWDVTVQSKWDDTPNTAAVQDEATLTLTLVAGKTFAGNAILTNHRVTTDVNDAIVDEWVFKGNGTLTEPA